MNITRRTVIGGMVAALFAPIVKLNRTIDSEKLLSGFCDDDNGRFDFAEPFGHGSLTYASDARYICRAEITNRKEEGEKRLPKNLDACWSEQWQPSGRFVPFELPPIESLTERLPELPKICPLCGDRRLSLGRHFPEQIHDDFWVVDRDYDVDTNTIRDSSCELCHGREYKGPGHLRLFGQLQSYYRLKPIAALPNVRISANRSVDGPLIFSADGFEGMAMGVVG